MAALSRTLHYRKKVVLLTKAATSRRVMSAIRGAAAAMSPGDSFLLTYSGHGGQVTDTNGDEAMRDYGEIGETTDLKDETCACTTGSSLTTSYGHSGRRSRPGRGSSCCPTPATAAPRHAANPTGTCWPRVRSRPEAQADRPCPASVACPAGSKTKCKRSRGATYARIQRDIPPREKNTIAATVALISGCQDNQSSLDGDRNGLFTEKLLQAWDSGAFEGSLHDLRNATAQVMPATQTPNYYVVGRPNAKALRRPALRI